MGNFSYKLSVGSFQLLVGSFQLPFCFSTTKSHKGVSQSLTKKLFSSSQSLASQSLVSQSLVSQRLLRSCVLTCLTVLLGFSASAQGYVSYEYDDSGNRISRTIYMPAYMPPPQDSTEFFVEDEEDMVAFGQDMENEDEMPQEIYGETSQEISEGVPLKTQEAPPQKIYTDALSETLITIYPNPTRGLLTVKIANMPQHATSSLTLFDIQGRVIAQQQTLSEENKLDISAQPVGTYVMRIAVGEETVSWKIVKMSEL